MIDLRKRYLNQPGVYSHKIVNPLPFPDFAPALPDLQKKNGAEIGAEKEGVVQKIMTTLEECVTN